MSNVRLYSASVLCLICLSQICFSQTAAAHRFGSSPAQRRTTWRQPMGLAAVALLAGCAVKPHGTLGRNAPPSEREELANQRLERANHRQGEHDAHMRRLDQSVRQFLHTSFPRHWVSDARTADNTLHLHLSPRTNLERHQARFFGTRGAGTHEHRADGRRDGEQLAAFAVRALGGAVEFPSARRDTVFSGSIGNPNQELVVTADLPIAVASDALVSAVVGAFSQPYGDSEARVVGLSVGSDRSYPQTADPNRQLIVNFDFGDGGPLGWIRANLVPLPGPQVAVETYDLGIISNGVLPSARMTWDGDVGAFVSRDHPHARAIRDTPAFLPPRPDEQHGRFTAPRVTVPAEPAPR